jgi:hypothetical protein
MAQKMGIAYGDNHEHDSKSQVGLQIKAIASEV